MRWEASKGCDIVSEGWEKIKTYSQAGCLSQLVCPDKFGKALDLGCYSYAHSRSLFCIDEAPRRSLLKLRLILPHGRRDRRPRLRLAVAAKALLETLKDASPAQHCCHISSASSLFLRVFCSIFEKIDVTNNLLLILFHREVAARFRREASSMISRAL